MTKAEIEKAFEKRFTIDAEGNLPYAQANYLVDFAIQIHDAAKEEDARRCEGRMMEYMASEFRALKIGGAK